MTDYLTPRLTSFTLSDDENIAIVTALATASPWNHKAPALNTVRKSLLSVKEKLKRFHLKRQDSDCAYCKTSLVGREGLSTDREHVLPKVDYPAFSYTVANITVACKRCNMSLKIANDGFIVNPLIGTHLWTSGNYFIVHPNFDDWYHHLSIISIRINRQKLVKYVVNPISAKGVFTHTYFKLRELEIQSFDKAQGLAGSAKRNLDEFFAEHA